MSETLQYLNSIGVSPTLLILGAILWRLDKRLTVIETKVM